MLKGNPMDDIDNLRESSDFLDGLEEEDTDVNDSESLAGEITEDFKNKFTPLQKFVVAFMAFLLILVVGFFVLLISGKIILPV